jgi:transcription antitermination factor NusG
VSELCQQTYGEPILQAPSMTVTETSWFAIQTRPRHEKKVATGLQDKGIRAFLPLFSARRRWSDRHQVVHLPLFPGYVFVRVAEVQDSRIFVLRTNGVIGFVGIRGAGVPIPNEQIDAVRTILERGIAFTLCGFLNVGQRIRIRGGSLEGLQGILMAKNGDRSLIVSVEIIQRSLAIRVAGYQVEAI